MLAPWVSLAASALLAASPGKLTVRFFDVGQGDAALVTTPTGKTVLIDAGPPDAGAHLALRLKALVKKPLDLVVLTHPHLDHLGGMIEAVKAVGAKAYLESGFDHPSEAYKQLLAFLGPKVERIMATADPDRPQTLSQIDLGDGATMWLLWPRIGPHGKAVEPFLTGTRSDPNSNSVVMKIVYGKTAFLMTGDAEPDTEAYLLQKAIDFTSTVLKVGHHGGRHSSTAPWLARVKPKVAVISCAAVNDYGHPAKETLGRLGEVGAMVLRTDRDGEITAVSDGAKVSFTTSGGAKAEVPGDTEEKVATGPILPGTRTLSEASIADRERYGRQKPDPSARPSPPPPPKAGAPTAASGYVGSKRSKVFHRLGCSGGEKIKEENKVTWKTREEAARDRRPAGDCDP